MRIISRIHRNFFHRHKNTRSKTQRLQVKKGAVCFWNCVILSIVVAVENILENAAHSPPEIFLVCNIRIFFLALFFWSLGIEDFFLNAWNLYSVFEVVEHMLPRNDMSDVIDVCCLGKPTRWWESLTQLTSISVIYSHFIVTFMSTCYCAHIHLVIFYCELLRVVIFITSLQILVSYQSHICYACFLSLSLCMCVGICSCKQFLWLVLTSYNLYSCPSS